MKTTFCFLSIALVAFFAASPAFAQLGADQRDPFGRPRHEEEMPLSVRENRERMRIDKEKKDYEDMIEHGQDIAALAERVEHSFTQHGTVSEADLANIEAVEKGVKKIRSDLGGGDDDETVDD